jgi:hypothetical protein
MLAQLKPIGSFKLLIIEMKQKYILGSRPVVPTCSNIGAIAAIRGAATQIGFKERWLNYGKDRN